MYILPHSSFKTRLNLLNEIKLVWSMYYHGAISLLKVTELVDKNTYLLYLLENEIQMKGGSLDEKC